MPLPEPSWDERGLVPAVVQDADGGAILMLAWMNAEAWALTQTSGRVHFWSRSRQQLWCKGESSGHGLAVVEVRLDCDRDAIVVRARPSGPTCHTGAASCFFRCADADDDGPSPIHIVDRLAHVIDARRQATGAKSYTRSLLDAGMPKILAKLAEEHGELAAELVGHGPDDKVIHETADLLFHMMVALAARDIPMTAVWRELGRRFGVSGHDEKAARPSTAT
jgi:phosphoribosyl-AMP cyclohydrolase / phosphoribosyl-ATP pyrophosphohydrolase